MLALRTLRPLLTLDLSEADDYDRTTGGMTHASREQAVAHHVRKTQSTFGTSGEHLARRFVVPRVLLATGSAVAGEKS